MYIGKIIAAYKHVSGKHCWVASITSQSKLSYISLQLFFYQPHIPIAAGFYPSSPESQIFVHLEGAHLHHLFPVTKGLNITDAGGGLVSIPQRLHPLLLAMSGDKFLEHWQKGFLRLKAICQLATMSEPT
jgi:hypothetical protein